MVKCGFNQLAPGSSPARLSLIVALAVGITLLGGLGGCVAETPTTSPPPAVPGIALDPVAGPLGGLVTVRGVGWSPGRTVSIYVLAPDQADLPPSPLASVAGDAVGTFETQLVIGALTQADWEPPGLVLVVAREAEGDTSAQALFNVTGPPEEPTATGAVEPSPAPTRTPGREATATPEPGPAPARTRTPVTSPLEEPTPTWTLEPSPSPARTPATPETGTPVGAATTELNVRGGPGTGYPLLGWLESGQSVEITGVCPDGGWWQIRFSAAEGERGWVSAAYMTARNTENVPVVTPPPLPPTPVTVTGWRGEYYNTPNLSGAPALVREDAAVNFDWGPGAPAAGMFVDDFSIRWTRVVSLAAGTYRFYAHVDDGVRLWVDEASLIDQWHDSQATTYTADVQLAEGMHSLRMEYYDHIGNALAQLAWERPDSYPDWKGEYFNNPSLSGVPVLVRNDVGINFDWGPDSPGPGVPADDFSARWSRALHVDEDGVYHFRVVVDDGARLWVDDELVIDRWRTGVPKGYSVEVWLEEGDHRLRLEYFEFRYDAQVHLDWE
jgi:uncharacterized protein YgiM (DUF1202 family)